MNPAACLVEQIARLVTEVLDPFAGGVGKAAKAVSGFIYEVAGSPPLLVGGDAKFFASIIGKFTVVLPIVTRTIAKALETRSRNSGYRIIQILIDLRIG